MTAPGWVLGDTLARAADRTKADEFIQLATTERCGASRGCIVEAPWRFTAVADVDAALRRLISDPNVSLMAMTESGGPSARKPRTTSSRTSCTTTRTRSSSVTPSASSSGSARS